MDYTGASQVSLSIGCSSNTDLANTVIIVVWSSGVMNSPVAGTVIPGSTLPLANGGGVVVPAFGTQLELAIYNNGATPISCPQLATYAVVH